MKQLLHTMRAFPTLMRVGFAEAVAYRAEFLVWVFAYTMPIIMLALWSEVAREAPVGRFGEKQFQAYFMGTLMVRLVTGAWVVWEMNTEVRQGTLQKRLLRPVHPLFTYLTEN
ncbi:MAG: transporter, inner rane subunit, partial [Myxococcaceae bacterium]|nr:transporter, inner rane subunit [Myxococcaceae bacterium]